MSDITLRPLDRRGLAWAQATVTAEHYLRKPVDVRTMPEGYSLHLDGVPLPAGLLIFGRPEATRCYPWYGSVEDVGRGRAECTRWEVLNLARVWLSPLVQAGGALCQPDILPGFVDRRGVWHSALASTVLRLAVARVGFDYLLRRPPCFVEEPYQLRYVLSYCDPRYHRGTIYRAAGFELYRTNGRGLMTWRVGVPGLTAGQDAEVRLAAERNARSQLFRARRAAAGGPRQLVLEMG